MTIIGILIIALFGITLFGIVMTVCFIVAYRKAREYEKEIESDSERMDYE